MRRLLRYVLALFVVFGAAGAAAAAPSVRAVSGEPLLLLGSYDLTPLGYSKAEYFISGNATSYKLNGPQSIDGNWTAVPAGTAPYATRMVVVRPTDPKKFNGTVVVEWLNVTAGTDASPEWTTAHREILRGGYAWIGVSAQKVGIEGGGFSLGAGGVPLKKAQPDRYGPLNHPGDAFSFDIYSQAGAVLRAPKASGMLGPLVPKRIISAGVSQSAVYLTTYVNAIDPIAKVYDGFLLHSRFGAAVPLEATSLQGARSPARLRTNLRVPVLTVVTETDVADNNLLGFHLARQPDNTKLRVWEVTGTAHADNYTFTLGQMESPSTPLDKIAAGYKPIVDVLGGKFAKPVNFAPQHHYVVEAALWSLDRWIKTDRAPASAEPIKLTGTPPMFVTDASGNAVGGVRTPWVDVPTARLSGVGNSGHPLAFLVGAGEPFDQATLDRLYPGGKQEYLKKFEASLNAAIAKGFILPADKQEILGLAPLMYHGTR